MGFDTLVRRERTSHDVAWVTRPATFTADVSIEDTQSEVTLWPPPKDAQSSEEKPVPKSQTKKPVAKDTVLTEESTNKNDMTTKVDSGRTVTIPNNEVVTVTRHTTITTDERPTVAPEPTVVSTRPSQDGPQQTSIAPSESGNAEVSSDGQNKGPLPTGAIIGIGVGAAALVAFVVIVAIMMKQKAKKSREQQSAGRDNDFGKDDRLDEKHFPRQVSAQTTGTRGSSGGDPFAPFGGRVNPESEYPNRPQSNTFEMDGTSAAPVELPDSHPEPIPETAISAENPISPVSPASNEHPADPQSNLNSLVKEDGKPTYVNHWNQYRAIGSN